MALGHSIGGGGGGGFAVRLAVPAYGIVPAPVGGVGVGTVVADDGRTGRDRSSGAGGGDCGGPKGGEWEGGGSEVFGVAIEDIVDCY